MSRVHLINLTPHPIVLRSADGADTLVPPEAEPARVQQEPGSRYPGYWSRHETSGPGTEEGPVPVHAPSRYGDIEGLPASVSPGDTLIVSLMVLQAAQASIRGLKAQREASYADPSQYDWRKEDEARLAVLKHLVAPGTGPADEPVRDGQGRIVAVTRLISVS